MLFLYRLLLFILAASGFEKSNTLLVESRSHAKKNQCLNVTHRDVRLGDLAVFFHHDKNVLESLINLNVELTLHDLDLIHNGGLVEVISRVLKSEKEYRLKNTLIVFELHDPSKFIDCDQVNENYLYNLAQATVLTKCGTCQVQNITNLEFIKFNFRPNNAVLSGRDEAQITFISDRFDRSKLTNIYHDVFISTHVWVTQGNLKKGQPLDSTLVAKQKKIVPMGMLNYLPPVDIDLSSYQSISSHSFGHVLKMMDLKKRDVVLSGQVLKGRIQGHLFEIESSVMAKRSGALGEVIPVQGLSNKKIFSGRIKSAEEVELLE